MITGVCLHDDVRQQLARVDRSGGDQLIALLFDGDAIGNRAGFQFHGEAAADIASARGGARHDHIGLEIARDLGQQRDVRLGAIIDQRGILAHDRFDRPRR